jgi:glyoxylase I family protein
MKLVLLATMVTALLGTVPGIWGVDAKLAIAQGAPTASMVRVRYIVRDVKPAVSFYTRWFRFHLDAQTGPSFASLSRGNLQLILSPPVGPGGASQPMPNGRRPQAGGWDRIILQTGNLAATVAALRSARVHFRNNIVTGPGGKQILLDDPSGNPIELFQPASR